MKIPDEAAATDPRRRVRRGLHPGPPARRAEALTAADPLRAPRRPAGRAGPAGVHARLVERAALGLLRAARLPGRLRALALASPRTCTRASTPSATARAADEDPRAGRVGPRVQGGGRGAGPARAPAGGGAGERARGGADGARSGCWRRCSRRSSARAIWPSASSARPRRWWRRSSQQVEEALEHPEDSKSALQELLARRGDTVDYTVTDEAGPPHDRTFEVAATVNGDVVGRGAGRSKKDAEQAAARAALQRAGRS